MTESHVQSLRRALAILRELNRRNNTTVDQLHRMTGLPKPTIVRLLGTLVEEGLVAKAERGIGYHVMSGVLALSAGYRGGPLISEAGRPWANDLTRRLQWPAVIAVPDQGRVAVVVSTLTESAISPYHAAVGTRFGLLTHAIGRAYIAYCPPAERKILLKMLAVSSHAEDTPPDLERVLSAVVKTVRRQGYARRDPALDPRVDAVAVPILQGGVVLGTIGLSFFRSAVSDDMLVESLVPALKEASEAITSSIERLQRGPQVNKGNA